MPPFAGFIGPSYQSRAFQADAERSINWFPEAIESPGGRTKSTYTLLSKPGLQRFTQLAGPPPAVNPLLMALNSNFFNALPIDIAPFGPTTLPQSLTITDTTGFSGPVNQPLPWYIAALTLTFGVDLVGEYGTVNIDVVVQGSGAAVTINNLTISTHGTVLVFSPPLPANGKQATVTVTGARSFSVSDPVNISVKFTMSFDAVTTGAPFLNNVVPNGDIVVVGGALPPTMKLIPMYTKADSTVAAWQVMQNTTLTANGVTLDLATPSAPSPAIASFSIAGTDTFNFSSPPPAPPALPPDWTGPPFFGATYLVFYDPNPAGVAADAVRAECALNNRAFAIAQFGPRNAFFEVHADRTTTNYGNLPGDRRPQIVAGLTQLLLLAGGLGYIFDLTANTLTRILDPDFPIGATKGGFLDAFFIVLEPNSQRFAISDLNDGLAWDPLDFGDVEGEPGNITTFVVDHRQIWFLGNNHSEIYINSGNANFPFTRLEGAYMEQGAGESIDGAFRCDNTIFWLGGNADGQGVFWRANGYTPQRISTHAIETLVASFGGDLSRVTGYPYQEEGHTFARWDFPDAYDGRGASLLYDCAGGAWHERAFWNAQLGQYLGDLARTHMFVWGKHLVGDWRSGTIYEQSQNFFSDAGAAIRRLRAAPDLANGGNWVFYPEFRLLMDVGVGLDGAGAAAGDIPAGGAPAGDGTDPQIVLQWSNDGGKTWSTERPISAGKLGDYARLVRWRQTGRSNNRCFRVIYSEPTDASLVAADLDIDRGL